MTTTLPMPTEIRRRLHAIDVVVIAGLAEIESEFALAR
jgi:hypothetical protein